jgi:tRNA A-37 threonylcarbamoyl transferase component Bud32
MTDYFLSDLEESYVNYLYKHIPILQNENLLIHILNYCKECKSTKSGKEYNIKGSSLQVINNILTKFAKVVPNPFNNNNNNRIINNGNKVIKKYKINALGLIEGIIFATLNYYNQTNNLNVEVNTTNKKIKLIMSKAPGIDLASYIIDLYKSNKTIYEKNNILFNILKKISTKLDYYQKNYAFIHGDFHSENIFVNNEIITFIDFEYSTIRLPSNKNIILMSPVEENISRKNILDLNNENTLKALDLFHLIENLKSFRENDHTKNQFRRHNNKFKELNLFIDKLTKLYKNKYKNGKIHKITIDPGFFNLSFSYLYPENFAMLNYQSLNNIKINNSSSKTSTKRKSSNNGSPYSSPSKR